MPANARIAFEKVDISVSEDPFQRYGVRIQRWPFLARPVGLVRDSTAHRQYVLAVQAIGGAHQQGEAVAAVTAADDNQVRLEFFARATLRPTHDDVVYSVDPSSCWVACW